MTSPKIHSHTFKLYLITDDSGRTPPRLADCIERGIAGGATAVQFREKNCGPTSCARSFEAVSKICEAGGVPLFLNADLLGRFELNGPLTGIHYSDRTLPARPSPRSSATGYSAHGTDDAVSAFKYNVDFCTLSPIFATPSKAGILDPIGIETIREARQKLPDRTLIALGGINAHNAEQCLEAGADGIAVIRAIMAAEDPAKAAARLREIVEKCVDV